MCICVSMYVSVRACAPLCHGDCIILSKLCNFVLVVMDIKLIAGEVACALVLGSNALGVPVASLWIMLYYCRRRDTLAAVCAGRRAGVSAYKGGEAIPAVEPLQTRAPVSCH